MICFTGGQLVSAMNAFFRSQWAPPSDLESEQACFPSSDRLGAGRAAHFRRLMLNDYRPRKNQQRDRPMNVARQDTEGESHNRKQHKQPEITLTLNVLHRIYAVQGPEPNHPRTRFHASFRSELKSDNVYLPVFVADTDKPTPGPYPSASPLKPSPSKVTAGETAPTFASIFPDQPETPRRANPALMLIPTFAPAAGPMEP